MVNARMEATQALINKRLGDTVQPASNLVPDTDVTQVAAVLYGPDKVPTAAERLQINQTLATANPNTVEYKALEFSRMDIPTITMTAVIGTGSEATLAKNALSTRIKNPEIVDQLKAEFAQFDTKYEPTLSDDDRKGLTIRAGLTPKERQAAELDIKAKKYQIILDKQQENRTRDFEHSVGQWEAPQDPQIRDEVIAIRDVLIKEKANKKGVESLITINDIMSRMDWATADPAKASAMVAYINSQASNISDADLYGPPGGYGNPVMTRSMVNAAITRARLQKASVGSLAQDRVSNYTLN